MGGRRQLRRRGHGRLLRPHRRHPAGRRRLPGRRQRPRHPDRRPQGVQAHRRRDRPHQAGRRRQVRRRRLQGVRRPPRRGRLGGQRPVEQGRRARSTATASATRSSSPTAGRRRPSSRWSATRPGAAPAPRVTFWPDATVFETTEFVGPHHARALPDDGLPQQGASRSGSRTSATDHDHEPVTYRYANGIVDFVKHVNATKTPLFSRVGYIEQSEDDARGRARLPVERGLPDRRPAQLRQRHRHHRGRHPRGGLPGRAHHGDQQVRPGQGPAQGEGPQPGGRGRPRGPHRHHLGAPPRAPVRGPDQGASSATPRSRPWCSGPPTRSWPTGSRSTPPRPTRSSRRASTPSGPGPRPAQARDATRRKSALDGAGMPDKLTRLLQPQPQRVRAVHRRGRLRRRLGHQRPRPADPGHPADPRQDPERRAGPRSTRCSRTTRSRPSSRAIGAGFGARSSTSPRSATTR